MQGQTWLWVHLAIGGLFVLSFLMAGRRMKPSKLNLRAGSRENLVSRNPIRVSAERATVMQKEEGLDLKELNPMFMYNGHHWDAYEVLGVPAGSAWAIVEKSYHDRRQESQPESHEFLKVAYETIRSVSFRRSS